MGFVIRSSSSHATPATPQEMPGFMFSSPPVNAKWHPPTRQMQTACGQCAAGHRADKGERPPRHCVRSPKRSTRAALPMARGGIWRPVQVTAVLRRASCPNTTVSRISRQEHPSAKVDQNEFLFLIRTALPSRSSDRKAPPSAAGLFIC